MNLATRRLVMVASILHVCGYCACQDAVLSRKNKEAIYSALAIAYPASLSPNPASTPEAKQESMYKINVWAAAPVPTVLPTIDQAKLVDMLAVLHPDVRQRFVRSYSVQEEIDQQPDQIQIADGTFQNTPQKILQKGSLTFTGAQMFPGTDEVWAEVQAWTGAGGRLDSTVSHGYCKPAEKIGKVAHCLLRDRTRDRFARFGSGLVATFSYSENNRLRNGVNIPSGSAAAFANNQISGSIIFDPSRLLHTGTDWKNAQAAAAKYDLSQAVDGPKPITVSSEIERLAKKRCGDQTLNVDCISALAGLTGAGRLWPLLFPQVTLKNRLSSTL